MMSSRKDLHLLVISGLIKLKGKNQKRTATSSVTGNYDPASLTFFIKGFNYPAVNDIS